jgi:hypothetical protein
MGLSDLDLEKLGALIDLCQQRGVSAVSTGDLRLELRAWVPVEVTVPAAAAPPPAQDELERLMWAHESMGRVE